MSIAFISDLHLDESRPATAAQFLKFMTTKAPGLDALYILGDFFEVWIGDDALTPFHLSIIQALAALSKQGVPLYFMHGNRDFFIGETFAKKTGCKLLPDPFVAKLYGTPVLLTHGDLLCTLDTGYQRYRRFIRSGFTHFVYLHLPIPWRKKIAKGIRQKSNNIKRAPLHPPEYYDATQTAIEEMMKRHQVNYLIHGHTHKPGIHTFSFEGETTPRTRIVLGEWGAKGSVLFWYKAGFSLESF